VQLRGEALVVGDLLSLDLKMYNATYSRWDFVGRYSGVFYSDSLVYGSMQFNQSIFPKETSLALLKVY